MNSSRNSNSRKKLFATTALVILVFVGDVLSHGVVRGYLRSGASAVSQWVARAGNTVVGSGIFTSRASLKAQNQLLMAELAQLQERSALYGALKDENEQLRALSHLAAASPGVTVPVVSSSRSSPYGTFLIGAGSADGITLGSLVLSPGGFVVGTVGDTAAHTAIVSEVFAPGASEDAVMDGASISVDGSGGGNARTKVPRDLKVSIGDIVVSPRFKERPIGVVGTVASSSASASQDVYIRLPVNLSSLQFVYVVGK